MDILILMCFLAVTILPLIFLELRNSKPEKTEKPEKPEKPKASLEETPPPPQKVGHLIYGGGNVKFIAKARAKGGFNNFIKVGSVKEQFLYSSKTVEAAIKRAETEKGINFSSPYGGGKC